MHGKEACKDEIEWCLINGVGFQWHVFTIACMATSEQMPWEKKDL